MQICRDIRPFASARCALTALAGACLSTGGAGASSRRSQSESVRASGQKKGESRKLHGDSPKQKNIKNVLLLSQHYHVTPSSHVLTLMRTNSVV